MTSFNLQELENELRASMEEDDLYWVRNEAKFRATRQGCNYEEFKAIVDTSHLKPVSRRDLRSDGGGCIPWNPRFQIRNTKSSSINPSSSSPRSKEILPFSSHKDLTPPSRVQRLFKSENYSPELVKHIYLVLLDSLIPGNKLSLGSPPSGSSKYLIELAWNIISAMFESRRLSLNVSFLQKDEICGIIQITKNVIAARKEEGIGLHGEDTKIIEEAIHYLESFISE